MWGIIDKITSSFSGTVISHILWFKSKTHKTTLKESFYSCINKPVHLLGVFLSCAKCWLLPHEKYGTRHSMILVFWGVFLGLGVFFHGIHYIFQIIWQNHKAIQYIIYKGWQLQKTPQTTKQNPHHHNTLFQTKTWGTLYVHHKKLL